MTGYIIRRLIQGLVVLLGVTTLIFFVGRLSGDPVLLVVGPMATNQEIEDMRRALGLDQPLPVQYIRFLGQLARGDFGESLRYRTPAIDLVLQSLPATLELAAAAFLITIGLAFPLGILAAVKRNTWIDRLVLAFALAGFTVPPFWLGILLILIFPLRFGMFYTSGRGELAHLVLPAFTLAMAFVGRLTRVIRGLMIEVLVADYIRTAYAKGAYPALVLWRHAFRNVLLAVSTVLGLQVALMLGGAILIENVFAWPGLGRTAVLAITQRDFPVMQAVAMVTSAIVVVVTLLVDLSYVVIDPRIRHGGSGKS